MDNLSTSLSQSSRGLVGGVAQAQMALTPFSLNMFKLLMIPGPLVATTKAEGSGNTLASPRIVGKLWPAGRKGFGRSPVRREERSRFSTKDSSRDPRPRPAVILGTRSAGQHSPKAFRPLFPHELEGTVRGPPTTSGQREFPRIPDSFYRGPLIFASRQTLRNAHKWPVRQSGTSRPVCIVCACIWE